MALWTPAEITTALWLDAADASTIAEVSGAVSDTDAAHAPIWIARTTISGTPTADDDSFKLQIRGDAD